ncbi:MAG: hypothetical protein PF486_00670, partial [Prolixibacteraceae bacterium]|nr:hypothetical protein [Prolixibacteraceae bacterium]
VQWFARVWLSPQPSLQNPEQSGHPFRFKYTKLGGVNYKQHNPATLNPIPPIHLLNYWGKDYETMQEQMIYGKSPDLDTLITSIRTFVEKINQLEWEIVK